MLDKICCIQSKRFNIPGRKVQIQLVIHISLERYRMSELTEFHMIFSMIRRVATIQTYGVVKALGG